MSRFTALFINAIVIVGLLTQTLTSSVAVITHASELAQVVAPISALNSPLAPPAPGIVPEVGLQKPRVRLQVDFESKNARDAQKVNGVVRAVRIDKNGIASTPFTVALDLPLGLDYLPGSSTGPYDETQRRLTWPDVTLDPWRTDHVALSGDCERSGAWRAHAPEYAPQRTGRRCCNTFPVETHPVASAAGNAWSAHHRDGRRSSQNQQRARATGL